MQKNDNSTSQGSKIDKVQEIKIVNSTQTPVEDDDLKKILQNSFELINGS